MHILHDQLKASEANLLPEVCRYVEVEPKLQPVTGEMMARRSANKDDNARLDEKARGVYRPGQSAFSLY